MVMCICLSLLCDADTPPQNIKMQKSIWNASSEVLKYNAVRPEHPVKIVDNAIKFLNRKYKVYIKLIKTFKVCFHLG